MKLKLNREALYYIARQHLGHGQKNEALHSDMKAKMNMTAHMLFSTLDQSKTDFVELEVG